MLQCVVVDSLVVRCSVLQVQFVALRKFLCLASSCSVDSSMPSCVAVRCIVLRCVAVCCSVL